jgi:hypothetical protein
VVERLVVVALVKVAFVEPRLVEVPLAITTFVAKRLVEDAVLATKVLVEVPLAKVRAIILVVARVEVPITVKSPVEVAPVTGFARNEAFCTHPTPFQ